MQFFWIAHKAVLLWSSGIFATFFFKYLYLRWRKDQTQGCCELLKINAAGWQDRGGGREQGGMVDKHLDQQSNPPAWLTLNVFLPTITILFLIVGQLGLLVSLILTHVPIIPIVIRQLRAVLRIYWGLVLIKESACRRQRRASSGRKGSEGSCRKIGRGNTASCMHEGKSSCIKRMTKDEKDEVNTWCLLKRKKKPIVVLDAVL